MRRANDPLLPGPELGKASGWLRALYPADEAAGAEGARSLPARLDGMPTMPLDVAEALLFHAQLRREEIPTIALTLLEAGTDTPTIRRLAGLTAVELSEAHELFRRTLQDLGRQPPTLDEAAKTVARYLGSLVLVEGTNLRQLAGDGARLAAAFNYHDALMPFYVADDEYDLPEVWKRADVDRELIEYARLLLGNESERAV